MTNLLYPKFKQFFNRLKYRGDGAYVKAFLMLAFGLFFWTAVFVVFCRVLYYFKGIDVFGDFLASKLLSMVFITFFSILIFSNVITAISSFFLSEELQLIIASPFDLQDLFFAKIFETIGNSSWMVLLFSLPVFLAYGVIFKAPFFYYIALLGTLFPFLLISGAIGVGIALSLVKTFPAKRLKDILFLLSILLIISLYFLFRVLRPERLVDPDAFFTVVDYLSALETPTSPFLPSQWATDILAAFLFQRAAGDFIYSLLYLWSSACAFLVILNWFFGKIYFDSWSKSQEAKTVRVTRNQIFKKVMTWILRPLSLPVRAIAEKDILSFFRDTAQWSQLFILSAIIVIYLYNFSVLPMDKSPLPTIYLQNIISFINLGLAGFVISAVAVRFAYPAVSLEGESFWIIKSSPLGLKGFLWCKFWINFALLLLLSEILIVCSNYLLRVDTFMMALSIVTIFLMTFGLTSLGIGCGAIYPRFKFENVSQIPTGFGGLLYMMLSVLFVGAIVVLEALPVQIVMMSRFTARALTIKQWLQITGSFSLVMVLCITAFLLPMKVGLKKLSQCEEF